MAIAAASERGGIHTQLWRKTAVPNYRGFPTVVRKAGTAAPCTADRTKVCWTPRDFPIRSGIDPLLADGDYKWQVRLADAEQGGSDLIVNVRAPHDHNTCAHAHSSCCGAARGTKQPTALAVT
jgi:hypothetical protein